MQVVTVSGCLSTGVVSVSSACYSLDLRTMTWTSIAPMGVSREAFSLVAYKGRLIAVGGSDVVESFDVDTGVWSVLTTMSVALANTTQSAALLGDRIFVVGGGTNKCYVLDMTAGAAETDINLPGEFTELSFVIIPGRKFPGFEISRAIFELRSRADIYRFQLSAAAQTQNLKSTLCRSPRRC